MFSIRRSMSSRRASLGSIASLFMKEPRLEPLDGHTSPVSDVIASLLGKIAANWTLTEAVMGHIITNLLNLPYYAGSALIAEMSSLARIQTIETLINLSGDKELIKLWMKIRIETNIVRALRNDAIHGQWVRIDVQKISRVKAKGKYSHEFYTVEENDLEALVERIRWLADSMFKFFSRIHDKETYRFVTAATPPGIENLYQSHGPLAPAPSPIQAKKPLRPPKLSSAQKRKAREDADGEPV